MGDIFGQASAEFYFGLVCEASGENNSAWQDFLMAKEHFKQLGAHGSEKDAQAGVARCCIAAGDYGQARQHLTELWEFCQQQGASGLEFPVLAYQTCENGFVFLGDHAAAATAVENGYQEVMARASRIDDPAWKESFLNNVPEHRAIIQMWQSNSCSS